MAKTPSKSAKGAKAKGDFSHRKRRRLETYSSYIYRVLKQVHPDVGISKRAMAIMNSFVNDIFERLSDEAINLARYNNKATLTGAEIQTLREASLFPSILPLEVSSNSNYYVESVCLWKTALVLLS